MALADLEYGESSIGVMLMREEGESKDWERWMRILGEGVRGGGAWVYMYVAMTKVGPRFVYGDFVLVNLFLFCFLIWPCLMLRDAGKCGWT